MKKKLLLSLIILLILLGTFAGSVSFFSILKEGQTENKISQSSMKFIYKELSKKGEGINLDDISPISDNDGKSLDEYFDFRIEAVLGVENITYNVIVNTTKTSIPDSYIKVYLTELRNNEEIEIGNTINKLSDYEVTDEGRIIYSETINRNIVTDYTKDFRLRLWLSEDVEDYTSLFGTTNIYTIDVNTQGGVGPTVPTITGGSEADEWVDESPIINLVTRSTSFSGIDYYEVFDSDIDILPNEITETSITTQDVYQVTTGGKHYIYYRAVAKDGLKSNWSNKEIINIDNIGPSAPTSGAIGNVAGSNTTGTIQTPANGSNDEGVGGITYKYLVTNTDTVPDKDSQDFTTDLTFERSCGTSYYGWVVAEDALGNRSEVKSLGSTSDGANAYSGWSACSKTCGTGTQTQTNSCALVTTDLIRNCNTQACAITLTTKVEIDNSQTGPSQWYLWVKLNNVPSAYQGNIKLRLPNGTQLTGNYQQGNLFFNTTTNSMINTSQCTIISTNPSGQWNLANYNGRSIVVGG